MYNWYSLEVALKVAMHDFADKFIQYSQCTYLKDGQVDEEGYDMENEAYHPLQAAHNSLGVLQLQRKVGTLPAPTIPGELDHICMYNITNLAWQHSNQTQVNLGLSCVSSLLCLCIV